MTDGERFAPRTVVPVDASPLLARDFDRGQVTEVRHAVAACAHQSGLAGQRLEDFVLAVNELITNAVRHGGGTGRLRMWWDETGVTCEVSDAGLGIMEEQVANRERPVPGRAGGWGLWLARQLSDEMVVSTGPDGTTVQVRSAIEVPASEVPANEVPANEPGGATSDR